MQPTSTILNFDEHRFNASRARNRSSSVRRWRGLLKLIGTLDFVVERRNWWVVEGLDRPEFQRSRLFLHLQCRGNDKEYSHDQPRRPGHEHAAKRQRVLLFVFPIGKQQ